MVTYISTSPAQISALDRATRIEEYSRGYRSGYAEGLKTVCPSEVVADFGKLELYAHNYFLLLAKWLEDTGLADCDAEIEFYPSHVTAKRRVIPYDVTGIGTEQEILLAWRPPEK